MFKVVDLSLAKKTQITEKVSFEFRAELYNAFNFTNFNVGLGNPSALTFGQVTSAGGARQIQLVGRINF